MVKKLNRLAVCISSQLRDVHLTLENIKETFDYFYYDSQIDYFIYAPDYITRKHTLFADIAGDPHTEKLPSAVIDNVKNVIKPVSMKIESDDEGIRKIIEENISDKDDLQAAKHWNYMYFGQFYQAERVLELRRQYELENDFEYDYVVRIRPDFYWYNGKFDHRFHKNYFYDWVKYVNNRAEFESVIGIPYIDVRKGVLQIGDQMFGGEPRAMDQYHKNMTVMSADILANKRDNHPNIWDEYWASLRHAPPEIRWGYFGLKNQISFQHTFIIDWAVAREYYYKKHDKNTDPEAMRYYHIWLDEMNRFICDFTRENKLNYGRVVEFFREKDIFKYKGYKGAIEDLTKNIEDLR